MVTELESRIPVRKVRAESLESIYLNDICAPKCGESDHLANDCDHPDSRIVCRRCKVAGHSVAQCIRVAHVSLFS